MATTLTREEVIELANQALEAKDSDAIATAVRQSLDWFAAAHLGKSVEVRVPPYRVVQVLGGSTHRRGTPPAIVELDPLTWLELVLGRTSWQAADQVGKIHASGVRSDLSELLPI